MFPIDCLRYVRMGDVTPGNLIYLMRDSGPVVAIRVNHPKGETGRESYPAALVLHDSASGDPMPLTDPGCGNQHCIDWGVRSTVLWQHPLSVGQPNKRVRPDPGYMLLIGKQPVMTSYYTGGRGNLLHWDVLTGELIDPGESPYCVIAAWRMGAIARDGSFIQLARYPTDYESDQKKLGSQIEP